MNSQVFTGVVSHGRHWPQKHYFSYPVYFYRFDLNELPELDRTLPGFRYNRFSVVRMDDKDYLWRGNQSLKDKIAKVLEKMGYAEPIHRVELISFAKYLNIIFRPVSFFLCYNAANLCRLILAEVHNTFRETHLYVLKDPDEQSDTLCFEIPKAFHVSPFFDMSGKYNIRFKDDGQTIEIAVELTKLECGEKPVFFARLTGQGHPLTSHTLYRTLLKYPFNAMLNIPRILRQSLTLYFQKKLPVYSKPIPYNEYTMRKQLPSWFARRGMKAYFSFFKKQSIGAITVKLPEGESRVFGPADSGMSTELQIKDYRFFSLLAKAGEIGLGIAYEKGYWTSRNLPEFMDFMLSATQSHSVRMRWYSNLVKTFYLAWNIRNKNTLSRAQKNISQHYDLSNAMYEMFLDETLTYSCAIFDRDNEALADAQLRKIDRILEKACLSKHHHLLEIGTGWGTLAIRAATLYGCRVTSITLSKEQQQLAQQRIAQAGLSDRIEVLLCDYRNVTGQYDRIISVEMLEAVGKAYYPTFFRRCDRLLNANGILVIQTITIPDQRYKAYSKTTDWMRLFIFPGGLLPSLTALTETVTKHTSFVVKHVESIGPNYALTLARWKERFLANREKILELEFSESFIRRWEYYFSYCQAGFAQHYLDNLQIVLTRPRNRDCINIFEQKIGRGKTNTDSVQ
jgi:cyclopropane-fatty-acyl-phospholipid synthase